MAKVAQLRGWGAGVRIHAKSPEWRPGLGQRFLEVRLPSVGTLSSQVH